MPPGRLLDPVSNDGARGMIVTPKLTAARPGAEADRIRLTSLYGGLFFSEAFLRIMG
jgi:hypothetical protein